MHNFSGSDAHFERLRCTISCGIFTYRASGLSAKAWSAENGVNYHTLKYWIQKENKKNASNTKSVQWASLSPANETKLSVHNYLSGIRVQIGEALIEVQSGFDPAAFENIVRILSKQCSI